MSRIGFKCLSDGFFADFGISARLEYTARYIESIGRDAELHAGVIRLGIHVIILDRPCGFSHTYRQNARSHRVERSGMSYSFDMQPAAQLRTDIL